MKRLISFVLALVLILSLGVTAFATETATKGSITITNATIGDTYKIYKIFDATYDEGSADTDNDGTKDNVSYNLAKTVKENGIDVPNPIFEYMFEDDQNAAYDETTGTYTNAYFTFVEATGLVERNKTATDDDEICKYLADMIRALELELEAPMYLEAKTADNKIVAFTELDYGYYLIDKAANADGTDVAVTITSNTPTVNVIDKNQKPATEFSKLVKDQTTGEWKPSNSAGIGDIIEYKIEFTATNYDGEEQITYYTVKDTKGGALWAEFDSITIQVGDKILKKGYYHATSENEGAHITNEWKFLGKDAEGNSYWNNEEKEADNAEDKAEWYLIHRGFDEFDIVIPWMTKHNFTGTTNGFTLTYGDNATSENPSPCNVVIKYTASVEPSALIGNPQNGNLWNSADLSWNTTNPSYTPPGPDPSTTNTATYALGLHKIDAADKHSMAGVVFEIYSDEACQNPVYVIPTNVKGVYILDDLNTVVSGEKRESSRKLYAEYLEAYLDGANQKNVLTTEANGKFAVLGLEAGTYWLKETKTLDGYNILSKPEKVEVGQTANIFTVVTDEEGNVVDSTQVAEGQIGHNYVATPVNVENSKGVQLPSTGGMGTMMLITFGTLVAIAFGVLMITQKKMSIYRD